VLRRIASLRAYLLALSAGFATSAAVYWIDAFLARIHWPAETTLLNETLLGILVAVLFLIVQRHNELRRQQDKFAVMKEMNHHIRNALQTIIYATFNASDKDAADKIRDAVRRIEWALREVMPAEPRDSTNDAPWPPVPPDDSS
jgi:hypothetical protein